MRLVKFFFCLFSWMISLLSTIIQIPLSIFEILWNCSEIFLEFLESLVCDSLNFINKYIIVRNTISPLQQSTLIKQIFFTSGLLRFLTRWHGSSSCSSSHTGLSRFPIRWNGFIADWFIHCDTVLFFFFFQTDLSKVTQFCSPYWFITANPEACWNSSLMFVWFTKVF